MHGLWMNSGRAAGAVEGGGSLAADMPVFYAGDHNFPLRSMVSRRAWITAVKRRRVVG